MASCDGFLYKKGGSRSSASPLKMRRNWTRRWCRLEDGVLSYYKVDKGQTKLDKSTQPRGTVKIEGGAVEEVEIENREHAFAVHSADRATVLFRAETAKAKQKWLAALKKAADPGGAPRPTSTEEDLRRCNELLKMKNDSLARELARARSGEDAKSADEDSLSSTGSVPKVSEFRYSEARSTEDNRPTLASLRADSGKDPLFESDRDLPLPRFSDEFSVKSETVVSPDAPTPAFSPEKPKNVSSISLHSEEFDMTPSKETPPQSPAKMPAFSPEKPKDAPTVDLHAEDFDVARRTPTPPPPSGFIAPVKAASVAVLMPEPAAAKPMVDLEDESFHVPRSTTPPPPSTSSAKPKKKSFLARMSPSSFSPGRRKKEKPPAPPAPLSTRTSQDFDF